MTVHELIERLRGYPPEAAVLASFDVSDHDTAWVVYLVESGPGWGEWEGTVVVLRAK